MNIYIFFVLTDPCYVAFHDEEWGVPVHDDKYVQFTEIQLLI